MGNISKLLDPLLAVFAAPRTDNLEAFVAAYRDVLGGYDDATLSAAASHIIATRESRSMPLPAECAAACRNEFNRRSAPAARRSSGSVGPEWSLERTRQADALIRSAMGRQAAREGWIIRLHDFCRHNRRLPDIHEARELRAKSAALRHDLSQLPAGTPISRLIQTMRQKAEELAELATN